MFKINLSTKLNLLKAVSKFNGGKYIDPNHVNIVNVRPFRGADVDTESTVEAKPGIKTIDKVSIRYRRKDITSLIPESLVIVPNKQLHTSDFISTLNKQYGFALEDSDIIVEKIQYSTLPADLKVRIHPDNPVWTGYIPVTLSEPKNSLLSMVKITDLVDQEEVTDSKMSADLLYYGMDFSVIREDLLGREAGSFTDGKPFRTLLNGLVTHRWVGYNSIRQFNLNGSQVIYNGTTATNEHQCNDDYQNVCIIKLGDLCSNYKGNLVLHYN